jgi:tRNA(fMet)-specific endonuclease VapC
MSGNLIDTNVIVKLLNGNAEADKLFDSLDEVHVSVITVGELIYGAHKSTRKVENLALFENLISEYPIVPITFEISRVYGKIKAELVSKGVNIPENDLWIAATAISNDYRLVTYDQHFSGISRLKLFEQEI